MPTGSRTRSVTKSTFPERAEDAVELSAKKLKCEEAQQRKVGRGSAPATAPFWCAGARRRAYS
jgi:hypothetical protein